MEVKGLGFHTGFQKNNYNFYLIREGGKKLFV